jgi:hypothetical protein
MFEDEAGLPSACSGSLRRLGEPWAACFDGAGRGTGRTFA